MARAGHPEWCGGSCDVAREGGKHRGMTVKVGDDHRRPLATVWLEQAPPGPVRVGMAVGLSIPTWTPDEALRVAAAIEQVAGPVARERV